MKQLFSRFGFTLIEVNLAVFVMAAGVLAMLALYPLGYRENQHSVEDVKAAAYADAVFNQLNGMLSARTLKWEDWEGAIKNAVKATNDGKERNGGWGAYCQTGYDYTPRKSGDIKGKANEVWSALTQVGSKSGASASWPVDSSMLAAIVVKWGVVNKPGTGWVEDHSRCSISMRISHNSGSLFAQPIFYTEIHFQGDQEKAE